MQVGGPAEYFAEPENEDDLVVRVSDNGSPNLELAEDVFLFPGSHVYHTVCAGPLS